MALGGWPGLVVNSKDFEPPMQGMFTLLGHEQPYPAGECSSSCAAGGAGAEQMCSSLSWGCPAPNSAAPLALQAEPSPAPLAVPFCQPQPWAHRGKPSSALWGVWGQRE